MAILMVIVVMMTTIFSNSDRVWDMGTGRANNCSDGRAAMNMMAHDLEYAVADDILTFAMDVDRNNLKTYGFTNSEICFVSLEQNLPEDAGRTAREVHYYVLETTNLPHVYGLRRAYFSGAITNSGTYLKHCYKNRLWYKSEASGGAGRPGGGDFLALNVVGLGLYAPDPTTGLPQSGMPFRDYYSNSNLAQWVAAGDRLPAYVDIYLEVLDEAAMARAAALAEDSGETDSKTLSFIEKNVRRYTTRVYFDNRHGYKHRGNLKL